MPGKRLPQLTIDPQSTLLFIYYPVRPLLRRLNAVASTAASTSDLRDGPPASWRGSTPCNTGSLFDARYKGLTVHAACRAALGYSGQEGRGYPRGFRRVEVYVSGTSNRCRVVPERYPRVPWIWEGIDAIVTGTRPNFIVNFSADGSRRARGLSLGFRSHSARILKDGAEPPFAALRQTGAIRPSTAGTKS